MRIIAGMGASACLALALAGCANKYGVEEIDYHAVNRAVAVQPAYVQPAYVRPVAVNACPTVAVMPFIGVGEDPACGYVVADAMAAQLRSCGDCVVISPETVVARAGDGMGDSWDPVEAGRRVGAPYVLTGRVTDYTDIPEDDSAPMVGLAVRLVETKTGRVVWTGNGSKSAPDLPGGGMEALTFEVCGDLAQGVHGNLDKNTPVPSPAEAPPIIAAAAPPVRAVPSAPVAPLDVSEAKAPPPAPPAPPAGEVAETPPPHLGEGTADWAIPLEEMPAYRRKLAAGEPVEAPDDMPRMASVPETVGAIFGSDPEEDIEPGAVLVPGAINIDIPFDAPRTDKYGVQANGGDEPAAPDMADDDSGAMAETPLPPRPVQTVNPQDAARMLDMFEDLSSAPDGPGTPAPIADNAPGLPEPAAGKAVPPEMVAADPAGFANVGIAYQSPFDDDDDGDEDALDGLSPEGYSTQFMVDYSLELEGDDAGEATHSETGDSDLDFFGKLSDSLFDDLADS